MYDCDMVKIIEMQGHLFFYPNVKLWGHFLHLAYSNNKGYLFCHFSRETIAVCRSIHVWHTFLIGFESAKPYIQYPDVSAIGAVIEAMMSIFANENIICCVIR